MDLDAVKRRYSETVTKVDAFGRAIMIGRLRPSQQLRVLEFTTGDDTAKMNIRFVCMVRQIDDDMLTFPRTRAEVDARIDRLEDEGVSAVMEAALQLFGASADDGEEPKTVGEVAKN